MGKLFFFAGLTVFIGLIFVIVANLYGYADPVRSCYISIDSDATRGNGETIKQALQYIRDEYPSDYYMVCTNVVKIVETPCHYFDEQKNILYNYPNEGCYIKGSRMIHILPDETTGDVTVLKRAKAIIHTAKKSSDYWASKIN